MIASGTWGYDGWGKGIEEDADYSTLGAVIPKTLTAEPQTGNAEPLWYPKSFREAYESGCITMLNALGIPNPGLEYALENLLTEWKRKVNTLIILSIAGYSLSQWMKMSDMIRDVDGVELNLSCPNVSYKHTSTYEYSVPSIVGVVRKRLDSNIPVIAKLSPNIPNMAKIVEGVKNNGAEAVTIANTMPAMAFDDDGNPVLGNVTGGLSGPALKPINLALVYHMHKEHPEVTIYGVGGILGYRDARDYLLAGASAVQVGSGNLINLRTPWIIAEEICAS